MAFFQLVLKARNLEKARQTYENEKLSSIEISKGAKPRYTLGQRLRRKKLRFKRRIKEFFNKLISLPKDSWLYRKFVSLRTDGTLENYILKSVLGFFGGIFLTYLFFVFFVFQLNFRLSSATMLCSVLAVILTLGLAFSYKVRCVVFLLLPQFFSKRGRQALMAYAFILALTGPAKNTLHNMGVLSESMACGQEQLKEAVKTIVDLAKQPFYALRQAISSVIKMVKVIVKKIKQTLLAIKRLVLGILRVITSVFQWLGSIVNMCNKKLGTPFDRCERVFEGAVIDCKAKLGPFFGVICNITYVINTLCYIVKPLDLICMMVSYISDAIVGAVRAKVRKFMMHMKTMFYVKVKFSHSFHFEANQTKTIEQVSRSIITEIRSRTDKFLAVFDWMSFLTSFFVFFLLLKVIYYRNKWLTNERFDNRYITDDIRTIDLIRVRQKKETIFPLNRRERKKYVPLSSVTLIRVERIKLAKSVVFLSLATLKLLIYMMVDYSLYWVLSMIRFHGRIQSKVERFDMVTVHVSGDGYLAELYRSIVNAFTPRGKDAEIDTMLCLPDPIPPNFDRYAQIVSLIVFSWLMAIFEPYGLRLRQVVMTKYYPDRAKQRAAWLYNHIMRSRGSFLKFARRQLRRKFGTLEGERIEKVTFRERIGAIFPFLNKLFPRKETVCLLCGAPQRSDEYPHIKCKTPGCIGIFCMQCFADLQNLCTICRSPMDYGDLSDLSEEKDSSDDQLRLARDKKTEEKSGEMGVEKVGKEEEKMEREQTHPASDSSYSYNYQDESPRDTDVDCQKRPFRDIEAQKIRDDVTIQIFNEPYVKETSSTSESATSCFAVRARRKKIARRKKKKCRCLPTSVQDSDSTNPIADTESWPTEEEIIHMEVDDDDPEKLLLTCHGDQTHKSRTNRIVDAIAKIPWIGKTQSTENVGKGSQTRRPSLLKRLVTVLQGSKPAIRMQKYRRKRKIKKESSASSYSSNDDENKILLKEQNRSSSMECLKNRSVSTASDYSNLCVCAKSYGDLEYEDCRAENVNLRDRRKQRFLENEPPRYLQSISQNTLYHEIDETDELKNVRKCVCQVEDINVLSDERTNSESPIADTGSFCRCKELFNPCSCTLTYETKGNENIRSQETPVKWKSTTRISKTISNSEMQCASTSKSENKYSRETETFENVSKGSDVKKILWGGKKLNDSAIFEKSRDSEETREKIRESQMMDLIEKPNVTKSIPEENIQKVPARTGRLCDSLADLELHGHKSYWRNTSTDKEIMQECTRDASELDLSKKRVTMAADKSEKIPMNFPAISTKINKIADLLRKGRSAQMKLRLANIHDESKGIKDDESAITTECDDSSKIKKKRKKRFLDKAKPGWKKFKSTRREMTEDYLDGDSSRLGTSFSEKSTSTEYDEMQATENRQKGRNYEEDSHELRCKTDSHLLESLCLSRSRQYDLHDGKSEDHYDDTSEQLILGFRPIIESMIADERFREPFKNYPVFKKFSPVYQNSALIEELKGHEKMKLIRQREASRLQESTSAQSKDLSISAKVEQVSVTQPQFASKHMPEEESRLPYQETDAYRNVMCEFQRAVDLRNDVDSKESVPLICFFKKTDKSKVVRKLFPSRIRNRDKSPYNRGLCETCRSKLDQGLIKKCEIHSTFDPDFFSEVSSIYEGSRKIHRFGDPPSADDTTDNN